MILFIDGYNLIFAASKKMNGFDIRQTEAAREALLGLLAKFKAVRPARLVVFFDGGPEAGNLPRRQFVRSMEIVFSDAHSDADTDIKNAVSHDDQPRNIRVITSDTAIRNFVARYGAQVTDSRDFLEEVFEALRKETLPQDEPIEKYEPQPSPDEAEGWARLFGEAAEDEPP